VYKALPAFYSMQDLSLIKIEEVVAALERATTVQEVKNHIDAAKAAEVYAKQAKLGKDLELKIFQYIKKAERKLGEMLKAAKEAGQITKTNTLHRHHVPNENMMSFTLEEAGISRKLSSRAQKLAAVPREEFDKAVAEGREPKAMKSGQSNGQKPPATGRRGRTTPQLDKAREIIRESIESAKPVSPHKLEQKHGISHVTFDMAITAELARKEALSEPPEIKPDMLSMTAQQKLDLAMKQHKEKLNREFSAAVNLRVQEFLENTMGPILRKEQAEARRLTESRKGVMSRKDYIKIRACLHPDNITDPERKPKYEAAFKLFEDVEKLLLNEKESPTQFAHIPVTPAEWDALRKRETERRKAKRGSKGGTNITGVRQ
jgi:hypothetical protein